MTKPVQRWDAPRGTTLAENNESGELVMFDDHQIMVDSLRATIRDCSNRMSEVKDMVLLSSNTPISDAILEILNRP